MPPAHEEDSKRNSQILSVHREKGRSKIAPVDHPRAAGNDAGFSKKEKTELTQAELKRLLHYDPETGVFTWRVRMSDRIRAGQVAGCLSTQGQNILVRVHGKLYQAHRLAWLYVHGRFPPEGLDHINGVRNDNRITNLRLADQSENLQNRRKPPSNNTSGFLGVGFHKRSNRWRAYIKINYKYLHLGTFSCPKKAHQAYVKAKRELHPFGML